MKSIKNKILNSIFLSTNTILIAGNITIGSFFARKFLALKHLIFKEFDVK